MSYRKTTYTVIVLSEDGIADYDYENVSLGSLDYAITEGPSLLHTFSVESVEVDHAEITRLAIEAGSDEGFFPVDDDD